MARSKTLPDGITVEIKEPLHSRIVEFHRLSNLAGTVQETARELIEAGLANAGQDGLVHSARRRAYRQASNAAYKAYMGLSAQLSDIFRAALTSEDR